MSESTISDLLKSKLQSNTDSSLVMYRLPKRTDVVLCYGQGKQIPVSEALTNNSGFLFSPATNSFQHRPYLIDTSIQFVVDETSNMELDCYPWPISDIAPIVTSHHDYLNQALGMIWAMENKKLKKAILSRILVHPTVSTNPSKIFMQLCKKYPNVMVYLVAIPNVGTWIGATPETLVNVEGGTASTMALAGTQKDTGLALEDVKWGTKEKEEQQIVSDNIRQLINGYFPNSTVKVEGPATVSTGALLHLNTGFSWGIENNINGLPKFVNALHPTPAIVGQPRESALELINQTETHDRAYYTGLLGPIAHNGLTHLFVNLRCMQLFDGYVALYVGGGLTADSNPEAEWLETELKAKTLLNVLN